MGLVQHHFFEGLLTGRQYFARVAIVAGRGATPGLDQNLKLQPLSCARGPWSSNSYPYTTKDVRPPISSELRRQMWASFHKSKDRPKEGSLLENPCLGCLAMGKEPEMLSPLLQNVVAAHIIANAKGGPHGEGPKEAWNFMPLCARRATWTWVRRTRSIGSTISAKALKTTCRSSRCSSACGAAAMTTLRALRRFCRASAGIRPTASPR